MIFFSLEGILHSLKLKIVLLRSNGTSYITLCRQAKYIQVCIFTYIQIEDIVIYVRSSFSKQPRVSTVQHPSLKLAILYYMFSVLHTIVDEYTPTQQRQEEVQRTRCMLYRCTVSWRTPQGRIIDISSRKRVQSDVAGWILQERDRLQEKSLQNLFIFPGLQLIFICRRSTSINDQCEC